MKNDKSRKFVVIGAGYTGLVAALRLAQAGHKVTILERSPGIGGLASDFKIEGASLERAYHHLFKTDTSIINLANELGIGDKLKWHDSSVAIYYNNRLYPFKGAVDLIKFKPLSLVNRIRAGMVVLYLQKTNNWKKFQGVTAYDWMLKFAGKKVVTVIWEPLLKGKFDKYYNRVSMAWLWARIHIRAQSREADGEKLGYFEGGFQTFTDALTRKLKSLGVTIQNNVDIKSLNNFKQSSKVIVTLSDGLTASFDACVATVPSRVFASLIEASPAVTRSYIKELQRVEYLGARLLIFSSTQDISPYYWHNINDLNLPFLVFINHTRLVDKKHYNGLFIYYIATYVPHDHKLFSCSDNELEKLWFKGIKQIFTDFEQDKVREKHFIKFANAQHIVDINYSEHIIGKTTPLNNVFLSNFSQIYPEDRGTNYAVRDGISIAEIALKNLI